MSNSACLNGGDTLFLTTLTRVRLPTGSLPSLRVSMADVEAHGGVELQRLATRGLLGELVDEDRGRARGVERTGQLAQGLRHQARLEAHVAVTHLALDLGTRHE